MTLNIVMDAILKINPNAKVSVKGNDIDTCEIEWHDNTTPISKEDIKTEIPTVETEIATAKQDKINLKASAKAKLIAGEPMTEEEANVLVGV
tara:strand:- start:36 stop:311 length:276 start_codon:yes stop_codon:yes gene_type:complete